MRAARLGGVPDRGSPYICGHYLTVQTMVAMPLARCRSIVLPVGFHGQQTVEKKSTAISSM